MSHVNSEHYYAVRDEFLKTAQANLEASSGGQWNLTRDGKLVVFMSIGAPTYYDNSEFDSATGSVGSTPEFIDFLDELGRISASYGSSPKMGWRLTPVGTSGSTGDYSKYFRLEVRVHDSENYDVTQAGRNQVAKESIKLGNFLEKYIKIFQAEVTSHEVPPDVLDAIIDDGCRKIRRSQDRESVSSRR
jgi:hypothetical protein